MNSNDEQKALSDLRINYTKGELLEAEVPDDPMALFGQWMKEAKNANILEPNAMTVSTVDEYGQPSSRVVLLKEVSETGFVFYTNYTSQKAHQIERHSAVAANLLWKKLERQVRISGIAVRISRARSKAYYQSRPKASRLGAWASHQSKIIESRDILDQRLAELQQQYADTDDIPIPEEWGGYEISPGKIEFWQGRPSRLHDRLQYRLIRGSWKMDRLSP